jgi:UDP-N-acetyl-D-glucosamine/UDP-N-acetyl-D-galactosamine dehydrogenase
MGEEKIAVVGLGYVGLPLAVEFGKYFDTIGFDIDAERVKELQAGEDRTREVSSKELEAVTRLSFVSTSSDITGCNIFFVTVPTPIDSSKRPDLGPLTSASRMVGAVLKPNDLVIYESTVYPGVTEEICVPILCQQSGLKFNTTDDCTQGPSFSCGYSPERINPGDRQRRLVNIPKVTSGSSPKTAQKVDQLYQTIIDAPTHLASSIKVAEASKVIENTQRDLNIALVNELALIFQRLGISTEEVLEAAGTKWNFLPFRPGLVGGHCIGVDPYYLTHKAMEVGYHPEVILAGRRINDQMGGHVAEQVAKLMMQRRIHVVDANVLIMGLAFKENCPDIRNSRVFDLVRSLRGFNCQVDAYDPWVNKAEVEAGFGFLPIQEPKTANYDAIIVATGHSEFKEMGSTKIRLFGKESHVLYDVKYLFDEEQTDGRL